jgi:hypothetical protein
MKNLFPRSISPASNKYVAVSLRLAFLSGLLAAIFPTQLTAQSVSFSGPATGVAFATANVCPAGQSTPTPCSHTLTLTYDVTAGGVLGTPTVVTLGVPNLDYTLASGTTCSGTVAQGTTCSVNVTFAPLYAGERKGGVQIVDASGTVLATTLLHGTGIAPQIAFDPAPETGLGKGVFASDDLKADDAGNVYTLDRLKDTLILRVSAEGGPPTTVGTGFSYPTGLTLDGAGDVFVVDFGNRQVVEVPAGGGDQFIVPFTGLGYPEDVAVDGSGNIFVTNGSTEGGSSVIELAAGGAQITLSATGLNDTSYLAVDSLGDLFTSNVEFSGGLVDFSVAELPAGGSAWTALPFGNLGSEGEINIDAAGDVFSGDLFGVRQLPAGASAPFTISSFLNSRGGGINAAGDVFTTNYEPLVVIHRAQPPSLHFDTAPGQISSPQSVQIQNIGNATLSLTGLTVSGDFNLVPGSESLADCTASTSLVPGAQCNLSIVYAPEGDDPVTGSVAILDNAFNKSEATQVIQLSGPGPGQHFHQTIAFTAIPAQAAATSIAMVATATSGLPVTFRSDSTFICTVSGATVTMLTHGSCRIVATQAGNSRYFPATTAQSFQVSHASQTIDFPTIAPQTALTPLDHLYATATSGLPVRFTSKTPDVCTVTIVRVDFLTAGSCDIAATQEGSREYFPTVSGQTFLVHHRSQVITFNAIAAQPSGTTLPLTASSDSKLPIAYASTTPTVCTVAGSAASLLKAGTCTIQASQAGNATYFSSGPKAVSFTVE